MFHITFNTFKLAVMLFANLYFAVSMMLLLLMLLLLLFMFIMIFSIFARYYYVYTVHMYSTYNSSLQMTDFTSLMYEIFFKQITFTEVKYLLYIL